MLIGVLDVISLIFLPVSLCLLHAYDVCSSIFEHLLAAADDLETVAYHYVV
jgi:hypothetical protein